MLTGRPLVVDSYEPHAEAMVENGAWRKGGIAFRTLFLFEKLQSKRARAVIAAAEGMQDYALSAYGHVPSRFLVKPACVDLDRFSERNVKDPALLKELGLERKLVAVYAGKFGGIYLDQEAFDLFRVARDRWGPRFHVLILSPHQPDALLPYMQQAGLDPALFTIRFVSHERIPDYLGLGDFAITPVKPVPTKRYCSLSRTGNIGRWGLPVVITPDISEDSGLIVNAGVGAIMDPARPESYTEAIAQIDRLLTLHSKSELYAKVRPLAETHRNFYIARAAYQAVYGEMKSGGHLP
ncbi:MAG: hypothetical protein IPN44_08860 [Flavobacteriales bacterium]|nr:hypothetical protein [Flavobacteriales bacterium]